MKLNYKVQLLILSILICFLSGCVTTQQLSQPLPKKSRIAILTAFDNTAEFKYVGVTVFGNKEYKHQLSHFSVNAKINESIVKLLKDRGYSAFSINNIVLDLDKALIERGLTDMSVTNYAKTIINRIKKNYHVDYLLVIKPSYAYSAGYDDISFVINGFGVYSFGSWRWKQTFITGGFAVYLFNTNDFSQFWSSAGEFHVKAENDLLKDNFNQYSDSEIRKITNTIEKEYPKAINGKVISLMKL